MRKRSKPLSNFGVAFPLLTSGLFVFSGNASAQPNLYKQAVLDTTARCTLSTGIRVCVFPTNGDASGFLARDSQGHIWVTNQNTDTVSKMRAKDGAVLGTYATGNIPCGVLFVNGVIWVANGGNGTISKFRASDGKLLKTITGVATSPYQLAFDGANIWISDESDGNFIKVSQSGQVLMDDGAYELGSLRNGLRRDKPLGDNSGSVRQNRRVHRPI